jgi:predicted DNA-binding protein (MmcQ/YjbR family)
MTVDAIREHCLIKKGTSEDFPFDEDTLVLRVMNKIFALIPLERWERGEPSINLKCDPEYAIELRESFNCIIPGFHMNKTHWNTVNITSELPKKLLFELIDHSYDLIVKGLPKKTKEELENSRN